MRGLGSSNPLRSSRQSGLCASPVTTAENRRISEGLCQPKGTGERTNSVLRADIGQFLSVTRRAGSLQPTSPFANLPARTEGRWGERLTAAKMAACRWLAPFLVVRIEFLEWTPENRLRHPRFAGIRSAKQSVQSAGAVVVASCTYHAKQCVVRDSRCYGRKLYLLRSSGP